MSYKHANVSKKNLVTLFGAGVMQARIFFRKGGGVWPLLAYVPGVMASAPAVRLAPV